MKGNVSATKCFSRCVKGNVSATKCFSKRVKSYISAAEYCSKHMKCKVRFTIVSSYSEEYWLRCVMNSIKTKGF